MPLHAGRRLPDIARDDCTGCQRCANACPHHCITMIWDFATLTQPGACTGCDLCADACRNGIITMRWRSDPP